MKYLFALLCCLSMLVGMLSGPIVGHAIGLNTGDWSYQEWVKDVCRSQACKHAPHLYQDYQLWRDCEVLDEQKICQELYGK